nr:hypothetical protein [Pseudomonas syringae pv. actinidiae]
MILIRITNLGRLHQIKPSSKALSFKKRTAAAHETHIPDKDVQVRPAG